MTSVQIEEVFLTEPNPARVGPSPNTVDVTNVICDNLTVSVSLNGAAFAGGIVFANAVQTLTNKTIIGGSNGNNISANSLRGINITNSAPLDSQVLIYSAGLNEWVPTTLATGGVNSVSGGTGITITGSGANPIVNIANTAVVPATYTNATVTVDQQGRITSASNGSSSVLSVTGGTGVSLTGTALNPIVNIANTAVTPATYSAPQIVVNQQGQITSASNILTTKGDILAYDSAPNRLPVGANGKTLTSSSGSSAGMLWNNPMQGKFSNIGLSASAAAGALTITLTQPDGVSTLSTTNPGYFGFVTFGSATSNGYNVVEITSSLSVTIPNLTTLGTQTGVSDFYVYVYAINNGATTRLAVTLSPVYRKNILSANLMTGADSSIQLYASSSISGPGVFIGRVKVTLVTPGVWVTPSSVELWLSADVPPIDVIYEAKNLSLFYTQSIPNNTTTTLDTSLGTADAQLAQIVNSNFDNINFYTVIPGVYEVKLWTQWPSSATGTRIGIIRMNRQALPSFANKIIAQSSMATPTATTMGAIASSTVLLLTGDLIRATAFQNSGAALVCTYNFSVTFMGSFAPG